MSLLDTKTKAPLVLLHRGMDRLPDAPRFDIMLSPQFYVSKREELPVKYPFQAKKLAPSILDDLTAEGTFTYEVFKEEDAWVFVAYDLPKLTAFLETKGGSIDRVRWIYFAGQAKAKLENPIELNEREMLGVVNDTATIVPKQLMGITDQLARFDETFRPEKHFDLKRTYNSMFDLKLAVALSVVLALLGTAYLAEGYRCQRALGDAETKLEALLASSTSLRGAYARESIHKKYAAIDTLQRRIRNRIKDISRLTGKEVRIEALSVDTRGYRITLSIPNKPKTIASLKKIAASGELEHLKISSGKLEAWGAFQ